jgi:hypothetical protein
MQLEIYLELAEKQRLQQAEQEAEKAEKAAFDLARRQLEEAKRQPERIEEPKAKRSDAISARVFCAVYFVSYVLILGQMLAAMGPIVLLFPFAWGRHC